MLATTDDTDWNLFNTKSDSYKI